MPQNSLNDDRDAMSDLDLLTALRKGKPQIYGGISAAALTVEGDKYTVEILHAELEQSIGGHHELRVTLHLPVDECHEDGLLKDVSKYTSYLGKSFSFSVDVEVTNRPNPEKMSFNGIVTRVDVENSIMGVNMLTLVGHSPTVLMDGARKNSFYRDQSATDIIGSILGNYKITRGTVDSSQGTLKFSVQYRETDYEYIMRLATEAGLFAYYDGQEFRVTKANSADTEDLSWRGELGAFTLGLGTAPCEFNARVYNYEQKKTYTQDTKSLTQQAALSVISKSSADASKTLYADSGFSSSVKVVGDAQSLDHVLQRDRSRAMANMIIGRGQSEVPTVTTGHAIKIEGMDWMDGTFWVIRVKHVYNPGQIGYYNIFECVPLDTAFPRYQSKRPALTHIQMAVVVDNNDPDGLGRLKVQFPWNDTDETPWVRLMTPHAGKDRGWYCLPEIGDEVMVGYEEGSPDYPVVLGAVYNKEETPPADAVNAENNVKMFMTRSGNRIMFTDTDGSEEIQIVTKDGKNLITMKTGGPTVIESEGAINIKAGGDVAIEGANISIESQGKVEIKSATDTKIEAGVNLNSKASAQYQIQGMTVAVKGNPIQLN